MTDQTEPIRRSELPSTPPPEWEFHTWFPHPDGGGDMVPGQRQRGVVVRRRVSYSDWEPVRPDRWADEPETDTRAAAPAGPAPATNQTALECAADIAEDVALRLRNECLLDQMNGAYEVMAELRRLAGEAQTPAVDPAHAPGMPCEHGCRAAADELTREAQQDEPTESVIYEVVGDWGVDSADSAEGARAAVAKWLRAYPKCGAHAQQRIVREWPDGSEFYGPWTDLPDQPAAVARPGQPETDSETQS
jgi:hypothetical protein